MQSNIIRKGIYPIQVVFDALSDNLFERKSKYIIFDGEEIKANSQRYQVFWLKGCTCCKCGLQAQYFALERHASQERYHLNLYARVNDNEILFTKDHIVPKSKGGKDILENYQTMCLLCNMEKGDT